MIFEQGVEQTDAMVDMGDGQCLRLMRPFVTEQRCLKCHAAQGYRVGDIRGGKGLLAAVELVEDRGTKAPFGADKKVGPRVLAEMTKRGVITRARLEHIFFAPPLVVSEEQVDRLVSVTRDAIKAVTGS